MMTGAVNPRHEIIVRVPVRDAGGQDREIEAVLDTGFTGSLTLPPALIAGLGLPWHSRGGAVLADGSVQQLEVYAATVMWDGTPRPILVQAIDADPLLGMAMLVGYDLRARVRTGGRVEIEAIP